MIKTAILVFVLIVIAVVIFYIGICLGYLIYAKRLYIALRRAFEKSSMNSEQKIELLDNLKKELR